MNLSDIAILNIKSAVLIIAVFLTELAKKRP